MEYLILLDRKFPYRTGESFLENEVEEIAPHFGHVLIYPSDPDAGEPLTRKIESTNVEIVPIGTRSRGLAKAESSIRAVGYFGKSQEHGARRAMDAHFLAEADRIAKRVAADLTRFEIGTNDTVYLYSYWLHFTALAACILKESLQNMGARCVAVSRAHRFDVYEDRSKLGFLPQRERLLSDLDHIYVVSADGARYIRDKYPQFAEKVTTSYLGTYDRGVSRPSDPGTFHIVSCSRVTPVKRVHLIAEALEPLKGCGVNLEWTHLGGGEELPRVEEAAKKISWMKVDLRGAMSNTDVYEYYATHNVDLFVNVSESEGLPVSIMEAISFGIPVVATAVGGTPEIVIEGVSGELIDQDFAVGDLASIIRKFVNTRPETLKELRATSRALWEERYKAVKNYRDFLDAMKSLIEVHRG